MGLVQRLQFAGARFFPYRSDCLFLLGTNRRNTQKQGFILNGIDAELFVQDIEGLPNNCADWDYINPKTLFEILSKSGILNSEHLYTVLCAFLEVRSFDEFAERVERLGDNWDDDVYIYEGYNWERRRRTRVRYVSLRRRGARKAGRNLRRFT